MQAERLSAPQRSTLAHAVSGQQASLRASLNTEIGRLSSERYTLLREAAYTEHDPLIRQLTASIDSLREQLPLFRLRRRPWRRVAVRSAGQGASFG